MSSNERTDHSSLKASEEVVGKLNVNPTTLEIEGADFQSGSNKGSESPRNGFIYQLHVTLYCIVSLLKNKRVENFNIYYDCKFINYFDDVVIILKSIEQTPRIYALQVKSKENSKKKLSVSKEIPKCRKAYKEIRKKFSCEEDNIHIGFFCDRGIAKLKRMPYKVEFKNFRDELMPSKNNIYSTFSIKSETIEEEEEEEKEEKGEKEEEKEEEEIKKFYRKLYFYRNQFSTSEIRNEVKKMLKINDYILKEITNFVQWHVLYNTNRGLNRKTVMTEFFHIFLNDYKVKPTKRVFRLNKEAVDEWFNVIGEFHVILMEDEYDIEKYVYGAIAMKIFGDNLDWNKCILENGANLEPEMQKRAKKLINPEAANSEIYTLNSLVSALWKCDKCPLLLRTESNIENIISDYKELEKPVIIVGSEKVLYEKNSDLKVYIGDVEKTCRIELKYISKFFQDRQAVNVGSSTDDDYLMKKLTRNSILKTMEEEKHPQSLKDILGIKSSIVKDEIVNKVEKILQEDTTEHKYFKEQPTSQDIRPLNRDRPWELSTPQMEPLDYSATLQDNNLYTFTEVTRTADRLLSEKHMNNQDHFRNDSLHTLLKSSSASKAASVQSEAIERNSEQPDRHTEFLDSSPEEDTSLLGGDEDLMKWNTEQSTAEDLELSRPNDKRNMPRRVLLNHWEIRSRLDPIKPSLQNESLDFEEQTHADTESASMAISRPSEVVEVTLEDLGIQKKLFPEEDTTLLDEDFMQSRGNQPTTQNDPLNYWEICEHLDEIYPLPENESLHFEEQTHPH